MELKIEYVNPSQLKPYDKNTRKHADYDVAQIAKSIERYGFNDPIGVWSDQNLIVEGHGRLLAAKKLKLKTVPIVRLDHLTDEQRREYAIAHNATAELSMWDFDALSVELPSLDLSAFDFKAIEIQQETEQETEQEIYERKKKEFEEKMESGELSEDDEEYQAFLEKFEAKKTTDDCYTHELVYDAVANYVSETYQLKKSNFVRPFYPGGDYQNEKYKYTDVVVDNPPFSILSQILDFYNSRGIRYFLFAPNLTIFSTAFGRCTALCTGVNVIYDNGATVTTGFVTNLENNAFRSAPELYYAVKKANDEWTKSLRKELPKYSYPIEVIRSSDLSIYSRLGITFNGLTNECVKIARLDAQKESDKGIFGSGLLLSREKAAEREKAEREKAERKKAERWELSKREKEIVESLGKKE